MSDDSTGVKSTALAIVPPEADWLLLQELRIKHDKHVNVWPPHINILYPFLPEGKFPEAARCLAEAIGNLEALRLCFKKKCNFGLTACLEPEPDEGLTKLYQACASACKTFDGFEAPSRGFRPHLTVGQFSTSRKLQPFLREPCPAVETTINSICLLARDTVTDPFQVVFRIRFGLGGAARVEPGDVLPYVYTPHLEPAPAEPAVAKAAPSPGAMEAAALRVHLYRAKRRLAG
eukprot:CAMPEP_0197916608 /NCGR_PEP_ID=MMETSP1439-20131203/82287_1 /TAXON_ID=66791 /ORGANISM="Gonyaulax spinifera, Strain CCMP409" /LENGTH=232 /DNA_ID=CAMNT_0043538641 /DNA_START=83 /DNA_END=777 /DNA_ORIENTATION=+